METKDDGERLNTRDKNEVCWKIGTKIKYVRRKNLETYVTRESAEPAVCGRGWKEVTLLFSAGAAYVIQ